MRSLCGSSPRVMAVIAVAAAAVFALAGGCSREKAQHGPPPAVPVTVAEAVSMDVPVMLSEIGTVEAFNTVSVTARVGGQLLSVGFDEGRDVDKGHVLFQIDPAPYQADLDQALANLERDRAKQAEAEADAARYAELVKKDYVTKQDYDSYVATAAAAKATVQADEAAVQSARLNLDYCTIRAPIAGRTGNLLVKEGNLITANSPNSLVTINQIAPLYVSFTIPEQQLADVRRYSRRGKLAVRAFPAADSANLHTGALTFIDNAVDEQTGTILLKATFPNVDREFWPGQFVHVDLILTKQLHATVVPASAVQASQQGDYVYVLGPDDTAELRPVVQGTRLDDKVVIETGVKPGERVVTDGQLRITPGAKVTIKSGLEPGGPAGAPASGGGASAPAGGAAPASASDSTRGAKTNGSH
jgi:multidrug efflux system membrane fusion protein